MLLTLVKHLPHVSGKIERWLPTCLPWAQDCVLCKGTGQNGAEIESGRCWSQAVCLAQGCVGAGLRLPRKMQSGFSHRCLQLSKPAPRGLVYPEGTPILKLIQRSSSKCWKQPEGCTRTGAVGTSMPLEVWQRGRKGRTRVLPGLTGEACRQAGRQGVRPADSLSPENNFLYPKPCFPDLCLENKS